MDRDFEGDDEYSEQDLEDEFRALGFRSSDERDEAADDEDDDDGPLPPGYTTGETDVAISMEVDADGNEVWIAEDSEVPGSSSMGSSLEEAMEGVEDRRRKYREIRRKSREERERRQSEE